MSQSGKVPKNFGSVQVGSSPLRRVVRLVSDDSFATQASAAISNLEISGQPGVAYKLPANCVVVSATVKSTTTVAGAADYDIGLHATTATTSATLFDGVALASVNLGAYNQQLEAAAGTAIGVATPQYCTVTVNTSDNTAGAIEVNLEYIQL